MLPAMGKERGTLGNGWISFERGEAGQERTGGRFLWERLPVSRFLTKRSFLYYLEYATIEPKEGSFDAIAFYKEIVMENQGEKDRLIQDIIKLEWEMFQKVEGIGGRANCQDQYPTFEIMRSSQFRAWDQKTLENYHQDLQRGREGGRNLITEKYAYMMESTDPDYYRAKLQPYLPLVDEARALLIRRILEQLILWDKEVSRDFPKVAHRGRPLEATADKSGITSVETYMAGELKTYSERTLQSLMSHILEEKARGENLVRKILEFTIERYGFASLEDAEAQS